MNNSPKLEQLQQEIAVIEGVAANYIVTTPEQYADAGEQLMIVKSHQKVVEEERTKITKPMNDGLKAANAFFKKFSERLDSIESKFKTALIAYKTAEDQKLRADQAREEEKARKEREKLEAQAAKASAAGREERAAELLQRAAAVVAPIVIADAPSKVTGISMRDAWEYEVIDLSLVPREFMILNEKAVNAWVGSMKGDTKIPGIRVSCRKVMAATARAAG